MTTAPTTAVAWFLGLLDAVGSGPVGKEPAARLRQCPAHPDASPSLSVGEGKDGRVLLWCFPGCTWDEVLAALTLPARYLRQPPPVDPAEYARAFIPAITFPPLVCRSGRSPQAAGYRLAAVHDYGSNHRVLRWRRGDKKELLWESLRDGTWMPGLFGTPTSALPLYREPDVRKAVALGEPVILVESESSVDALTGYYATTWAGGASSVQIDALTAVLGGYGNLIVIPDRDTAGLACLDRLRAAGLAPHILLPDPGEDARDMLARLGTQGFTSALNATTPELREAS